MHGNGLEEGPLTFRFRRRNIPLPNLPDEEAGMGTSATRVLSQAMILEEACRDVAAVAVVLRAPPATITVVGESRSVWAGLTLRPIESFRPVLVPRRLSRIALCVPGPAECGAHQ